MRLSERLKSHVYTLSHEIGERSIFKLDNLERAAAYIAAELPSFGYSVEFQPYTVSGIKVKNIIAVKRGATRPKEIIIVGAHYDTCYNPGADDNASAVAGLIELAMHASSRQTERTIKFIAFVNEEPPFFKTENMGSWVYTRNARSGGEDIKAALILEMIGYYSHLPNSQRYPPFISFFYPNKGDFIAIVGNIGSRWLVNKVTSLFKKYSKFPVESLIAPAFITGVDFSDNWSFWQEGYPAVMITDTGFYRNNNYHSKSDTYQTLDYESTAEVVEGITGVLAELTKK